MTITTVAPVDAAALGSLLDEMAPRFGVPGAALAVSYRGETTCVTTGVTNVDTGVPVTRDTVFQIGSISKVYVATLIFQLMDEGLLDLDRPISAYLPDLKLGWAGAPAAITARHLLTHTCGLEGDYLADYGWGDDSLRRYVESMATLGQLHPPGAMFSYCNSGYQLAAALVERLRQASWHDVLRSSVLDRLGCAHTGTRPVDALLYSAAVGHVPGPDLVPRRVPAWASHPSLGPVGATIFSTVDDVLSFVRTHLDPDSPVLSAPAAREMRRRIVDVPVDGYARGGWASGWMRTEWDGVEVFGHDGSNLTNQFCGVRVVPDRELIICVLTNSGTGSILTSALMRQVVVGLTGLRIPAPPQPGQYTVDLDPSVYTGRYERLGQALEVSVSPDGRALDVEVINDLGPRRVVVPLRIEPIDATTFGYIDPPSRTQRIATFSAGPDAEDPAEYFCFGFRRLHRRVRRGPRT